jgi:hypothetical protein
VSSGQFKKREVNPALNSLFQQYYLSPAPEWLHYSFEGKCFINYSITYLNYDKLMKSFSFDYFEAFMTQVELNKKLSKMSSDSEIGKILLTQQHDILATVIERVRASNYTFLGENIKQVNIIWVDPIWDNLDIFMKQLAQSDKFYGGFPLWVSFCQHRQAIEKKMNSRYQNLFNGIVLGAESFSVYNNKGIKVPFRVLDFDSIIGKNREINLLLPQKSSRPKGFQGTFKNIFYY